MSESHIIKSFNNYVNRYKRSLSRPFPSERHMGIPERNLTVNFAFILEEFSNDIVTWYEVPISNSQKDKNDNHLDAVILDLKRNEVFLIESKRLREKRTINSICKDIARVSNIKNINTILQRFFAESEIAYKIYGIVLFDLWTSNDSSKQYKWNKMIFESMKNSCFYRDYLKEPYTKEYGMENFDNVTHCIENVNKKIVGYSYNLGALVFRINYQK